MFNLTNMHWSPEEALNVAHNMVVQHVRTVSGCVDRSRVSK